MTELEPAHLMWADNAAVKLLVVGLLGEMLERAPDRKAAAEALLHRALNATEGLRIEGVSPDAAEALRDAIGERVAAIVASAFGVPAATRA